MRHLNESELTYAIADSLRLSRRAANITQGELAAALGISRRSLVYKENGCRPITAAELAIWCYRCGIGVADVIDSAISLQLGNS